MFYRKNKTDDSIDCGTKSRCTKAEESLKNLRIGMVECSENHDRVGVKQNEMWTNTNKQSINDHQLVKVEETGLAVTVVNIRQTIIKNTERRNW